MTRSSVQLMMSSALTLLLVTLLSLYTAYILGPLEFGLYAALQAVSMVIMPLVSLRFETRVAVCTSEADLKELSTAVSSVSFVFLAISSVFTVCLLPWINGWSYLSVALLASGMVLADFGLSRLAFGEQHGKLAMHRFARQVLPVVLALLVAEVSPQHQHVFTALIVGTWIWALVLGWPKSLASVWSWQTLQSVWHRYHYGLKASVALGALNALWLNGLQPLMAWFGWHQLAGQYALLQRLINAPLSVLTVVVSTFLLSKGNALHMRANLVLRLCAGLAGVAALWVICLWFLLFNQTFISVPAHWVPEFDFYWAVAFFWVCSFAIGAVSVISVRLKDEWFFALWQLILLVFWVIGFYLIKQEYIFVILLLVGGMGYGVLLLRWILLIKKRAL